MNIDYHTNRHQYKHVINIDKYKEEIDMLSVLSETSISGVITTNYDEFVETFFNGYTKFVGQSQLIFSAIQGIAEIYKIHGSVEEPQSLVINEQDYVDFDKKRVSLSIRALIEPEVKEEVETSAENEVVATASEEEVVVAETVETEAAE